MSKGNYQAVMFKQFVTSKLFLELLKITGTLVIGVDVGKEILLACVMGDRRDDYGIFRFKSDEIIAFCEWVEGLGLPVTVVLEPTGTYGEPLENQLVARKISVHRVPTKRVSDMKDVFDNSPSNFDNKAAFILACLYRIDLTEELRQQSEQQRRTRAVLAQRDDADGTRNVMQGKLEAMLARHWPEVTEYMSISSATLLELLKRFGGPEAVSRSPQEARALMLDVGGTKLKREKIDAVVESASSTRGVPMVKEEVALMQRRAAKLRKACQELRRLDAIIKELVDEIPEVTHLAETAGPALACALIAYLGSVQRYDTADAYCKAAGMNLCWRQSGKSKDCGVHISKRGPGIVRKLLYLAALRMIGPRGCPVTKAWYQERLRRNGGHRLKGIVAVMRKLIRALYHLGDGQNYDPTKLFNVNRLNIESTL